LAEVDKERRGLSGRTNTAARKTESEEPLNPRTTLRYITLASALTTSTHLQSQSLSNPENHPDRIESLNTFLARIASEHTAPVKRLLTEDYVARIRARGRPIVEDSTVYLLYLGNAKRVRIASDLNSWDPSFDSMQRIPGTELWFDSFTLDEAGRFEYKLVVDSTWMLDPLNRQQAIGGYGPNSEVWMPYYAPPKDIEYNGAIKHGTLDTLRFQSKLLGRSHPLFVYLPFSYKRVKRNYPSIFVLDGGEYLSLALMKNVLDNLIAGKRIEPVIGIFIDPRTHLKDASTSKRMTDYALSDTFMNAVITELYPRILRRYRIKREPDQTAILGASLGGLTSTYIAYMHPETFGLCAAQSPSYFWKHEAIIKLIAQGPKEPVKFHIDTGTLGDALPQAFKMKTMLESKGYEVQYEQHPEGHNWVNWRSRLPDILTYFWGLK
jgi:enterochelin esterase-like enzyme